MASIDNFNFPDTNNNNRTPEMPANHFGPKGFDTLDRTSQILADYFLDKQLLAEGVKERDLAAVKQGLYAQTIDSREL